MTSSVISTPSRTATTSDLVGAVAAAVAGTAALSMSVYLIAREGPPEPRYETFLDFLGEAVFLVFLAGSGLAAWRARRAGLAPRAAAAMVAAGYGAIFVGVAIAVALRDDPAWFMVLGGPGQLLSMAGFVTWAVWARRREVFGWSMTLLCGVGGLVVIVGSEAGLSVILAGFWFGLAARLRG